MRDLKSRLAKLEGHRVGGRRSIHEFTDAELEAIVAGAGVNPCDDVALETMTKRGRE